LIEDPPKKKRKPIIYSVPKKTQTYSSINEKVFRRIWDGK
jgi:hypothetical protein